MPSDSGDNVRKLSYWLGTVSRRTRPHKLPSRESSAGLGR